MKKIFPFLLTLLLLHACVTNSQLSKSQSGTPVSLADLPVKLEGLSILPPQDGSNWSFQRDDNKTFLRFGKPGGLATETVIAQVLLFKLPPFKTQEQLLKNVMDGQKDDTNLNRFTVLQSYHVIKETTNAGVCVRYTMLLKTLQRKVAKVRRCY